MLTVSIPKFRELDYIERNPDVKKGIDEGKATDGWSHFLKHGIDENRSPKISRDRLSYSGDVGRCLVSESGYVAIFGWLGDEGCAGAQWRLFGGDFGVTIPASSIFRYARQDVEAAYRDGPYDYGFVVFGRTPSKTLLTQPFLLQIQSLTGSFQIKVVPESATDKRLLDVLLIHLSSCQSHSGLEVGLYHFLSADPGESITQLFQNHVNMHVSKPYVERFRPRSVKRSFVTVLFGSTEPILMQPMLFRNMGIDFGEWIFVCNSPEDARDVLRIAKLISDLYDLTITVVAMTDNVGFGAANNVGISFARSDSIYIVNPDVFAMNSQTGPLTRALDERTLGDAMWGGLLFYDDENLMHSGMFMEHDVFVRSHTYQKKASGRTEEHVKLVRVEHFDKGAPFRAENWRQPKVVPAISGAVMAFKRPLFERIGGFSTRYIYGHYEDADLSLRWADANGPVMIDPDLRFVHLEGQGSRSSGGQYRGAQILNRYLFSARHNEALFRDAESMTKSFELPIAAQ